MHALLTRLRHVLRILTRLLLHDRLFFDEVHVRLADDIELISTLLANNVLLILLQIGHFTLVK